MPGFWQNVSKQASLVQGNPGIFRPHLTLRTLLDLPLTGIGRALPTEPRIRALVLDKDNTLCPPNTIHLDPTYRNAVEYLKQSEEFSHHKDSILIVSNTVGKTQNPQHEKPARELESELGIPVFRHYLAARPVKKPFIAPSLIRYFRDKGVISKPDEVVVVGDKILMDVRMARFMASWSIYLEDGWRDPSNPGKSYADFGTRLEQWCMNKLKGHAWDDDDPVLLPWERPVEKSQDEMIAQLQRRRDKIDKNRNQGKNDK
ncbi:MAG: hypothetical protein Q9227_009455 [Pyrenula ochraceoflavens]